MNKLIVQTKNSTYTFVDGLCAEAPSPEAVGLLFNGFYDLGGAGVSSEPTGDCVALLGEGTTSRVVSVRTA